LEQTKNTAFHYFINLKQAYMKKIYKSIILLILIILPVASCTEKSNLDPEGQWTLSNPSIKSPNGNTTVVLSEAKPDSLLNFTWTAASSSANYGITYSVVFDTLNSANFESPILEVKSGNGGKDLSLGIKASALNESLSLEGYPANAVAQLSWAVKAYCLSKTSVSPGIISVKRFATEIKPAQLFISGEATEKGSDLSQAIPLKRLNGADGSSSNKFEVYTSLTKGKNYKFYSAKSLPAHLYGGSAGTLVKSGAAINADETGVFRITVDIDNATYSLKKIEKFSVVGANINGGWGGDEALVYQGGGIWKRSVELIGKGGFVFRANGDWGLLLKRVKGTTAGLVMESDATSQGAQVEDIPSDVVGTEIVTLDLSASGYTYKIERDPNAAGPIATPASLFLLQGTTKICEFTKNGDVFTSTVYLPLQGSVTYTLNSAADGSGTSYSISAKIGATTSPGSDKVVGNANVTQAAGTIGIETDQAYLVTVDFSTAKLSWQYYNMKLFHWSNWETRDEFVMTYVHPLTFTVTANLTAGYELKFNSPWDIQFSPDVAGVLSGTMTSSGNGPNFKNIPTTGKYKATIVVNNDFKTGTYTFVTQ
jgi:hypothetical protein